MEPEPIGTETVPTETGTGSEPTGTGTNSEKEPTRNRNRTRTELGPEPAIYVWREGEQRKRWGGGKGCKIRYARGGQVH